RFAHAWADHSQPKYDIAGAIDGEAGTGWAINGSPAGGPNHNRIACFVLSEPLEIRENDLLTFTLQFNNGASAYNLGRVRISASPDAWANPRQLDELVQLAS